MIFSEGPSLRRTEARCARPRPNLTHPRALSRSLEGRSLRSRANLTHPGSVTGRGVFFAEARYARPRPYLTHPRALSRSLEGRSLRSRANPTHPGLGRCSFRVLAGVWRRAAANSTLAGVRYGGRCHFGRCCHSERRLLALLELLPKPGTPASLPGGAPLPFSTSLPLFSRPSWQNRRLYHSRAVESALE